MKFEIDRDALLEPLQFVSGVVERRQTLPVLANLMISVEKGRLTLVGTDLEVELSASLDSIRSTIDGAVTIPARKFSEICRSLPGTAPLVCSLEGERMSIVSGRFRSHLATLEIIDFPTVEMDPVLVEMRLAPADFKRLLDKTSFAMGHQDVRYFFNGMLFVTDANQLTTVATNGQRLAVNHLPGAYAVSNTQQFIVPRKGVVEMLRMVKDDTQELLVQFSRNHLRVVSRQFCLVTKLIDATYPDYERAIPAGGDVIVVGNRREIKDALTRTAILANETYRNIRFELTSGNMGIYANNPLQEEAEENVPVDYDGADLKIGFNVDYIIDALSAIDGDRVQMTFIDGNSAMLLAGRDESLSRFVVSPMIL